MALTRAQLLMGNDQQGAVLPGEVQAVKQGAGIFIDTDGTISVDASSVVGLVKLNSLSAFNGYVWPNTKGGEGQMLTMGTGNNLVWTNGGVYVDGTPPLNPEIGDLWFDCSTGQLLVYEACTSGSPKWTSGSEGLPVLPGDTSASPAFVSGDGTAGDPYICSASSASVSGAIVVNRVTIIGLAPFQFVPIIDLNAVVNGGRFSASNNVANASGILIFDLLFNDSPTSPIGVTYTCALKVGYGSVYIDAPVTMTDVFVLNSAGTISGVPQVSLPLTYTPGTAAGGAPPYTPSWVWKRFGDNTVLQTGGTTYTPDATEFGNSVYVTLTIQDNEGQIVTGSTSDYGPIAKPPFPNPTPPVIPASIGVESCFTWDGASTTLEADGCLLFKVGAGAYSQGPTAVVTGNTVCTKWADTAPNVCGNAPSGTFIEGCLFDTSYSSCSSLTIDRIPDAISILPESVAPGAVATSFPVTITGNNAPAYITVAPSSTGSNYFAAVGGGSFQAVPTSGTGLSVLSGQSLVLRFTTGPNPLTTYNFNVQLGDSTGNTTATFAATTTNANFPTTSITFPTTTSGTGSVGTSVAWGNGTTNISATGCIEFSLDGTNYTQASTQIEDNDILRTRFISSAPCGDNANGQTISGSITNTTYTESTSLQIDRVPNAVTFATTSGATTSTQYSTGIQSTSGFNSTGYVTLGAGTTLLSVEAAIGGGGFSPVPASGTTMPIEPGQSIQIRGTTDINFSTDYVAEIVMGVSGATTTSTWTVQVGAPVPAVATPHIVTPGNGDTGVGTSAGLTLTSSNYSSSGGAGAHASSSWQVYAAEGISPTTSQITNVEVTPNFTETVTRSVRFNNVNPSGSAQLSRTPGASGDLRQWTWSGWIKKGNFGVTQGIFVAGSTSNDQFNLFIDNGSGKIAITDTIAGVTALNLVTTDVVNPTSKWIHVQIVANTDSTVSSNRMRLYVNGDEVTAFDTAVYYPRFSDTTMNNAVPVRYGGSGVPFNGNFSSSLALVNFVDGQNLLPTSFGVLSGSSWVPTSYTGTYGTQGYELLFGTGTTDLPAPSTLGKDSSGNNNDFEPTNIYLGNSGDSSFSWLSSPPTGSPSYLAVGKGGNGTPSTGDTSGPSRSGGGGGGGGGGGVITGTYSASAGQKFSVSFAVDGSITYNSQTAAVGAPGGPYNGFFYAAAEGGASGAPQSNAGGSAQNTNASGGGGGGGAGGAGGNSTGAGPQVNEGGAGGVGFSSSITGSSLQYGAGGAGGRGVLFMPIANPLQTPGEPGKGLPGQQVGGFIISLGGPPAALPPVLGAYLTGSYSGSAYLIQPSVNLTTYPEVDLPLYADWLVDSPTPGGQTDTGAGGVTSANYAILDGSARNTGGVTLSNGGLDYSSSSGMVKATFGLTSGKYYWEIQPRSVGTVAGLFGLALGSTSVSADPGSTSDSWAFNASNGQAVTNGSGNPYGSAPTAGQTIGVAFDATAGRLYFAINNVWQNSGNPATATNPAFFNLLSGPYFPAFGGSTSSTLSVNFGQRPYKYNAPAGFQSVYDSPYLTTLTFQDDTFLSDFAPGDAVNEVGGDASGVVSSVSVATDQMTIEGSTGTWDVGSTVEATSKLVPAPAPTTEPPDPLLYTLIASATDSSSDLLSFTVAAPPLDPFVTYYARVRYKSDPTITESAYSSYSQFTTGSLP